MTLYDKRIIGDNILAAETIAIAMPTFALIPSAVYASYVYSLPNINYTGCVVNGVPAYLPDSSIGDIHIYEPFSTSSNLAYIMSALAIYLYYIPNGAFVHMQMYTVGTLFILLGTGSAAMHADGSRVGGWQHATDIFGIYALFISLAGVSFLGVYHAIRGKPQSATSKELLPAILNAVILLAIGGSIFLWRRINQAIFLTINGAIIIISNASTQGIFALRSARYIGTNELCAFVTAFLVCAIPRVIVLSCALYINLTGRMHPIALQSTCTNASDIEYRIEVLKQWDWIHGVWHYISATSLTAMALTSQQGLDGVVTHRLGIENTQMPFVRWLIPFAVKSDEYVEELISRAVTAIFAIACVIMFELEASAFSWQIFVLTTSLSILPIWSIYALYSINRTQQSALLVN